MNSKNNSTHGFKSLEKYDLKSDLIKKAIESRYEYCQKNFSIFPKLQFELFNNKIFLIIENHINKTNDLIANQSIIEYINSLNIADLYLATACSIGDNLAWITFDKRFKEFIYKTSLKYLHNQNESESCVKEIYSELFYQNKENNITSNKIGTYNGLGSLINWLRVVINRYFIQKLNTDRQMVDLDKSNNEINEMNTIIENNFSEYEISTINQIIKESIEQLTSKEKNILFYYYLKEMPFHKIAGLYQVNASTIYRWLKSSLKKCQNFITNNSQQKLAHKFDDLQEELKIFSNYIDIDFKSQLTKKN